METSSAALLHGLPLFVILKDIGFAVPVSDADKHYPAEAMQGFPIAAIRAALQEWEVLDALAFMARVAE